MQSYNVTEARKQFSQIINSGKTVEIKHPQNPVIIIPKDDFQAMEDELLMREMDEALERAKGQKWYTSEEVDAMMAEILSRTQEK